MTHRHTDAVFPVVIIGGGLAGLVAGAHLAGRDVPPLILDADKRWPGGRLAGGDPDVISHAGHTWAFKPDHGVHAVWGGYENLRATLSRFTQTRLLPSYGEEWINRWGRHVRHIEAGNAVRARWLPAPFHYLNLLLHPHIWANIAPWDFLSLPGLLVSIALTVGVDPIKEGRALDSLPMREYFRGWTPNLRATFEGLGVNLLAAPAEEISLGAFIAGLRFYTMLRRDSWAMQYFPADSHTSLIQPLADHIERGGGALLRGWTAQRLDRTPEGWRVIAEYTTGERRTFHARDVVIATHAPGASRLLAASPETARRARDLIFPQGLRNVVIRLWFKTAPPEGTIGGMFTGDFLPDNFFWLHRLYPDFIDWHAATGGSAVEVHLYGDRATHDQPDANLLIEATAEVQRAWPILKGQFLHGTVRRNSGVHTRFRVPDARTLAVVTPWEGISACGDWVAHDTPALWMERSSTTGIAAANAILQRHGQEPYPVLAPPAPEIPARLLGGTIGLGRRLTGPLLRRRSRAGDSNDSDAGAAESPAPPDSPTTDQP